jgi:hypothetical protein
MNVMRNAQYRYIETHRIAGALGAAVSGVNLADDLPDEVLGEVRAALLERGARRVRVVHAARPSPSPLRASTAPASAAEAYAVHGHSSHAARALADACALSPPTAPPPSPRTPRVA